MVLGIAGGSCSGKSTLARLVNEAFGPAEVIGLDTFYTRDMERGPLLTLSDRTVMFDFNDPRAVDVQAAVEAIQSASPGIVVVEGLFALAIDSIRELLDYKIFVHYDADLRAIRRLLRDMKGGRMSTDPEFIARYYIESARVGHIKFVEPSRKFADLIVIGDNSGMIEAVESLRSMNRWDPNSRGPGRSGVE